MNLFKKHSLVVLLTRSFFFLGKRNKLLGYICVRSFCFLVPFSRVSNSLVAQYISKFYPSKSAYPFFDRAYSDIRGPENWMVNSICAFFELQMRIGDPDKLNEVLQLSWPSEVRNDVTVRITACRLCFENEKNYEYLAGAGFFGQRTDSFGIDAIKNLAKNKFFDRSTNVLDIVPIKDLMGEYIEIRPSKTFTFLGPEVFESREDRPKYTLDLTESFVSKLSDVEIVGAFQVLHNSQFVLYEKAAKPNSFLVAGVWQYFGYLSFRNSEYAVWFQKPPEKKKNIQSGILLSGRATENYFHWLIEYIPKLYNIEKVQLDPKLGLIVKSQLPQQFYQCLNLMSDREQILVDPKTEKILVDQLYIPSTHTYLPDDFSRPYWIGGGLDYENLRYVRDRILSKLNLEKRQGSRKFYIHRPPKLARSLANSSKVLKMFQSYGYEIVAPEKLTFAEQVQMFREAKIIFGVAGAAYANVIFCNPGCNVVGFLTERNREYCLYSNLAQFSEARFINFTGDYLRSPSSFADESELVHAPFKINLAKLERLIVELEGTSAP